MCLLWANQGCGVRLFCFIYNHTNFTFSLFLTCGSFLSADHKLLGSLNSLLLLCIACVFVYESFVNFMDVHDSCTVLNCIFVPFALSKFNSSVLHGYM